MYVLPAVPVVLAAALAAPLISSHPSMEGAGLTGVVPFRPVSDRVETAGAGEPSKPSFDGIGSAAQLPTPVPLPPGGGCHVVPRGRTAPYSVAPALPTSLTRFSNPVYRDEDRTAIKMQHPLLRPGDHVPMVLVQPKPSSPEAPEPQGGTPPK